MIESDEVGEVKMSDHLKEEKGSVSPSSSLEQYDFDDKLYETFISILARDLGIIDRDDLGGGLSGARTSSVRLEGSGTQNKKGQFILKVCLSGKAEREIQMYQSARASSILRRYVPEYITSKRYPDLPLTGILYEVAGGSHLMRTTLQKSLELDHFPWDPIEALARVMLRWNFSVSSRHKSQDLLGTILKGVEKDGLTALIERLKGIVDYPERPQLILSKLGVLRYNPLYFLLSQEKLTPLRQMPFVIPEGILHRDLHPGNVIIPLDDDTSRSFHVIDFATPRPGNTFFTGNAFFDLAYLELTILLNSFRGFHSIAELKSWWKLEQYLISTPLPRLEGFVDVPQGLRVLPIRRVLARKMKQDRSLDDYWVAFLAASVEAALDLARKIRRRSPQRAALLTAVSRFHYLLERLGAIETVPGGEDSHATMYWPGEEPPPPEREEKKISVSELSVQPYIEKRRAKLDLVWPGEINQCRALYDPWEIVEMVGGTLAGENDQGVLLVGERKFGKTSFLNCLIDLIPKKQEKLRAVRLDTLNIPHSAQSFSSELFRKMCESAGLPFDEIRQQFDREGFFPACQLLVNERKDLRFVICVDEIDATLDKALSIEDGHAILHLLTQLLTDPSLPVRLLLTVTDKEILARYRGGTALLEDLQTWKIPLCISVAEVRELIDRFEVPVKFDDEALDRIFYYSGGQIYFVKLAVRLAVNASGVQADGEDGKRRINAQRVDKLLHEVISPLSSSSTTLRSIHESAIGTMTNIYSLFFSKEEQQFMQVLAEAKGVIRISTLQVGETQFEKIANELYQRGYISKVRTDENEEYSWRIGIWQLFLEEYHQLRYRKH